MAITSNPVLSADSFQNYSYAEDTSNVMTVQGTAVKTAILGFLAMSSAVVSWIYFQNPIAQGLGISPLMYPVLIGSAIGGLILAMIISFKPTTAPWLSPIYALIEGVFLGIASLIIPASYGEGELGDTSIVFQALFLTFGVLFMMMTAYSTGFIKATEKFKAGMAAALGAIFFCYLISFVLRLFGFQDALYLHSSSTLGIGISVVFVIIASLALVLDFDFIEQGAANRAPKYMEWYGAFGLLVTLVWLYIELLKLLSKLQSRD